MNNFPHSIAKLCTRIASVVLLATSFAASAQVWTPISGVDAPGYGGMIRSMTVSNDGKIWAAIEGGGLYVSSDAGVNYTSSNVGIKDLRIWNVLIDSTGYSTTTAGSKYKVYAASMGGGVYVSTDSGATFTPKNSGLTCTYVRNTRLVGTRLIAATDCGANSGVYYSDDGATTWKASTGIPADATVSSTTYSTSVSPALLLANTEAGIYKSTDSGATWVALASSPTGPLGKSVFGVTALYDAAATDKLILLATVPGVGVFSSKDQGASWAESNKGMPTDSVLAPMSSVNVETGTNVTIALDGLGLYKSTDRGANWTLFADNTKLPGSRFYFQSSAGLPTGSTAKMHAGTIAGTYASSDSGATWVKGKGLPGGTTSNVTFDSKGATYASTASGTFKLDSSTKAWTRLPGLPATDSSSLSIKGIQLYSGTNNFGIFKYTGTKWEAMNNGLPADKLVSANANLRPDNSTPDGLYVGLYGAGFYSYNGTTWIARNNGLSGDALYIRSVAANGQTVFIITNNGAYRSTDGGQTWVDKGPKVAGQTSYLRVSRMAIDPYNAGVVYASIYNTDPSGVSKEGNGLWKSTDNGDTWTSIASLSMKMVQDVRVLNVGDGYIATASVWDTDGSGGLYASQDKGVTWQSFSVGLNTVLVNGVFASPISNTSGYVATRGAGLFTFSNSKDDDRYFGTYTGADGVLNYNAYYGLYDKPKTYTSMTLSNGSITSQATYDTVNGKWNVGLNLGKTAPSSSTVYTVSMLGATSGTKTVTFSIGSRGWNTQPPSNVLPNETTVVTASPDISWTAPNDSIQNTIYQVEIRTNDTANNMLWSSRNSIGAANTASYSGPGLTPNTNYQVNVTAQTADLFAGVGYGATRGQVFCFQCTTTTLPGATTTTVGGVTTTTQGGSYAGVAFAKGWNLMGNGTNTPFAVGTLFSDSKLVTTIWKWLADKGTWAFYTPTLSSTALADYAKTKGFEVLTTVNPGDGFWVNTPDASTFKHPQASTLTAFQTSNFALGGSKELPSSWSLIAIGDNKTVSAFNNEIIPQEFPPQPGKVAENATSVWAWDAAKSGWYFYAPSLVNKGTLSSYIKDKQYLDFGSDTKLTPSTGFWVNLP